jgi:glycerol-3-phosphate dehydrogenase
MCNWGLVPFGEDQQGGENLSYGKRSVLVDHADSEGPSNLVSLIGIRYTMGRGDSEWAMNLIARKLGDDRPAPGSDRNPLFGGDVPDMSALESQVRELLPAAVDDAAVYSVARSFGAAAPDFVQASSEDTLQTLESSHVLDAQLRHAARHEMAMTLGDAIFRRTDLASGGNCSDSLLTTCARVMASELGWSAAETDAQIADVRSRIPGW